MAKAAKAATTPKVVEAPKEKVKLTVSQILSDLNDGLDRKAIRTKYGLSATDVARLFQNPKLKGARVRTAPAFELEDDTAEQAAEVKDKPKAETKPVTSTKVKTTPAPKAEVEEKVVEEEQGEEEVATEEITSEGIKEVASEQDSVKDEEEKKDTGKGLW